MTVPARIRHRGDQPLWSVPPDGRSLEDHMRKAVSELRCWACGGETGKYVTFVLAPIAAVTRVAVEPPYHADCAAYVAEQREALVLTWTTASYRLDVVTPQPSALGGLLFSFGAPSTPSGVRSGVRWWLAGGPAPRGAIMDALEAALGKLRDVAETEEAVNAQTHAAAGTTPKRGDVGPVAALDAAIAYAFTLVPESA